MGVTKYILKHPVTTVMALLCLVVFGISSVFSAKLEQMPDMETPMLIIMANYSGAGPEDISELVTEPIEEAIGTMEGVDTISSTSSDGRSMIMLQYDYGTDMDDAYNDLSQSLDALSRQLPDDAETSVMEMNNNAGTTMMLSISNPSQEDLYDYVRIEDIDAIDQAAGVKREKLIAADGPANYMRTVLNAMDEETYQLFIQYHLSTCERKDLLGASAHTLDIVRK